MTSTNQSNIPYRSFKFLGYIIGFISSAFFLMFFIGEGVPGIVKNGTKTLLEILPFLLLLMISISGYVTSIFNEKIGGITQICGGCAMGVYHLVNGGLKDMKVAIIFGLPFILCGLIFIICWRYKFAGVNRSNS